MHIKYQYLKVEDSGPYVVCIFQDAGDSLNTRTDKMMDTDMYHDSSDEEMFETSDDDDEDDDEDDAPSRHRLEWDDGLQTGK